MSLEFSLNTLGAMVKVLPVTLSLTALSFAASLVLAIVIAVIDYFRVPVLQAAGRVIRTAEDVGIVALLDDRFFTAPYRKLFPREWADYRVCSRENVGRYFTEEQVVWTDFQRFAYFDDILNP